MARRHQSGNSLLSKILRCQELILARSGVDEFYEVTKLLLAKHEHELRAKPANLDPETASKILEERSEEFSKLIQQDVTFEIPAEVIQECLSVLKDVQISNTSLEVMDTAFEALTAKSYKADKGQYFTPRYVVEMCVKALRPEPGTLICDPACGSGAFLQQCDHIASRGKSRFKLFGFDISERAVTSARLMGHFGHISNYSAEKIDSLALPKIGLLSNSGNTIETYMKGEIGDFNGFDYILTNPPFAGDISSSEFKSGYELSELFNGKLERDIIFVERCVGLLRPGGRMAIVLPDNKVSSRSFSAFREWLLEKTTVLASVSLHPNTFRPHTSQKAAVLFLEKPKGEGISREILMAKSELPGKTSNGTPILTEKGQIKHDLNEISDLVYTGLNR